MSNGSKVANEFIRINNFRINIMSIHDFNALDEDISGKKMFSIHINYGNEKNIIKMNFEQKEQRNKVLRLLDSVCGIESIFASNREKFVALDENGQELPAFVDIG